MSSENDIENEEHETAPEEEQDQSTDEEEEPETQINSNGSVLMPSDSPYDKFEKIKEANDDLFTIIITKPRSPCKVHFSPTLVTHSLEYDDTLDESILTEIDEDPSAVEEVELNSSTESSDSNSTVICRPSKVLLVTVPTAFTEQIDDEDAGDIDTVDDDDEEEEDDDEVEEDETYEITNVDIPDNDSQLDTNSVEKHSEEEILIEDLTDDIDVHQQPQFRSPSLSIQHAKPVLMKNARIEEDSDSEIDRSNRTNNIFEFPNESVEELAENFQECTISSQEEVENIEEKEVDKFNSSEYEDENYQKDMNEPSPLSSPHSFETDTCCSATKEEKRSKNVKNKTCLSKFTTVCPNLRSQCPIFIRNYGTQPLVKKTVRSKSAESRPSTAPSKRHCCNYWDQERLPEYNGFRSEYGLTVEQLFQRKREKLEHSKSIRQEKERKYMEEIRRQKENDLIFNSWLVKKKKEAAQKFSRKKLQSTFQFKTIAAPTKHLEKVGALRKKLLKREHTSYSLEEFFKNANPHEQKTYRIYLGLSIE